MKKTLLVIMMVLLVLTSVFAQAQQEEAAPTFAGKNVKVVIGSKSASGDSYLIADAVARYLSKELNCNMKVEGMSAAAALDLMLTAPADGNTIMIFHDMTYLGVTFGQYDKIYSIENMTVGPRVVQNPASVDVTRWDAPFNTIGEIPEYLKANPDKVVRWSVEGGGTSQINFDAYYDWVLNTYGPEIAKRNVVIVGGDSGSKNQQLWDNNTDVIGITYDKAKQYVETDDKRIKMKILASRDLIEGKGLTSYADQGVKLDGKPYSNTKDFWIFAPKDLPASLIAELDEGMKRVAENPQFAADLGKMLYRPAYLPTGESKSYLYDKRDTYEKLISRSPSLDDLVQQ